MDYEYWFSKVTIDGGALRLAPLSIRNDKNIVIAAVQQKSRALEYATTELRNDKDFILQVVRHKSRALQYASTQLRNDRQVVMAAVQKSGAALKYASPSLQNDKEIVLAAIQNVDESGYVLKCASPQLQRDKEVVIASVQNDDVYFQSLRNIAPEFQHDKEVILAAIKSNPDAIKYIPDDMKHDTDVLIAAGMYDENHDDASVRQQHHHQQQQMKMANNLVYSKKKIVLSTRFSLNPNSESEATNFTKLLKDNGYIQRNFILYAPNAFDKKTCDPRLTDFNHPCRGTKSTCQYNNILTDKGHHPTDDCCWRYSFRYQLQEAKSTGGFMLQLIETGTRVGMVDDATLGNGQNTERDMANQLGLKTFQVYRPMTNSGHECTFYEYDIDEIVSAIKAWYDDNHGDDDNDCDNDPHREGNTSECIILRPGLIT